MYNDMSAATDHAAHELHEDLVGDAWSSAARNAVSTLVAFSAAVYAFSDTIPTVDYTKVIALGMLAVALVTAMTAAGTFWRRQRLKSALDNRLKATIARIDALDPEAASKAAKLDKDDLIETALSKKR